MPIPLGQYAEVTRLGYGTIDDDGNDWERVEYAGKTVWVPADALQRFQVRSFVESLGGSIDWDPRMGGQMVAHLNGKNYYIHPSESYYWNVNGHFYTTDAVLYHDLGLERPTDWGLFDKYNLADVWFAKDTQYGVWYAKLDAPQRWAGYNDVYDIAFTVCDYMKFEAYFTYKDEDPAKKPKDRVAGGEEREWRIEGWKGNYLNMGVGGEIGLYYRNADLSIPKMDVYVVAAGDAASGRYFESVACLAVGTQYWVVDKNDRMEMEFDLYRGKAIPQNLIFHRPRMKHWWITGFRSGIEEIPADELTMRGSITFPNSDMAKIFDKLEPDLFRSRPSANLGKFDSWISGNGVTVNFTWGR